MAHCRFENNSNNKFKWFHTIKDILCSCVFSGIWDNHLFPNKNGKLAQLYKSNRKAMNRNWINQKANPALKTKAGNK